MPANQALRCVRQTTSSFFASKLDSHRDCSVSGRRRIALRGQASLQRGSDFQCGSGACPRWRLTRISGQSRPALSRASLAPTGVIRWSEACPRIGRCGASGRSRHRSSRASPVPAWLCSTNSLLTSNGASRSVGAPWVCSSVTHAVTARLYVAGWLGCYVFLCGLR